ncbi:MAG TPA: GNAT family N-acetyltransferase [Mobilitalea sp.]|nr:GNAT family N-acetyltransferase [Mobilitalea sp.]
MITPILESQRMILRQPTLKDAEHIFKSWTSDPEVAKFMIWDVHESVGDTTEWLKMVEEELDSDQKYNWGFVLKETGELIGTGGIYFKEEHGCFELGYNIMKKYWGQGLTTEASKVILEFASNTLGQKKLLGEALINN